MANYLFSVKNYLIQLFFILTAYSLCRVLFLFCNFDYIQSATLLNFIGGIRFDIAIICLLNLPFTLLIFLPVQPKFVTTKPFQITLLFWNAVALSFNVIDAAYFAFTLKRTTSDLFITTGIGMDIIKLIPSYVVDFWYLLLLFLVLIWSLSQILNKYRIEKHTATGFKVHLLKSVVLLCALFLSVIGYRGGFQLRPMGIVSASSYGNSRQIPLILNTPFAIVRTATQGTLKKAAYFSDSELNVIFSTRRKIVAEPVSTPPKNVVLIVLESFGEEYIGSLSGLTSYTPFLDSLIPYCTRPAKGFANGKKSIEAMPAITASIPSLMETPFVSSRFAGNAINALPNLLNEKGYHTSFFHGGANGTMGFDVYASLAGYKQYFGQNEYPNPADYDGNWGIPDEPYLQYFCNSLSTFKPPFFSTVFTISSHHPFKVPAKYQQALTKGTLPIHQSIGYADLALKKFFETAKTKSWYNNTLFVITADHTSLSNNNYYQTSAGVYAVPILFFEPGKPGAVLPLHGQHLDITPTILDWLHQKGNYSFLGQSLLQRPNESWNINYLEGFYQLLSNGYLIRFDGEKSVALFNLTTDSLLEHNQLGKNPVTDHVMEQKIKAVIQQYNNRLLNNSLTEL